MNAPKFDNVYGCRSTPQKATVHARQSLEWAKWALTVTHKEAITDYIRQSSYGPSIKPYSRSQASRFVWKLKKAAKLHGDLPAVKFTDYEGGKALWLFDSLAGYRVNGMKGSFSLYRAAGSRDADAIKASATN